MSFYALAVYFWCAVAALGVMVALLAVACQFAADTIGRWLSPLGDDEPLSSGHQGPVSVP